MSAMLKLSPSMVSLLMLCGTAYAGDIALTCSGTRSTVGISKASASMNLVVHQEARKVTSSSKNFGVSIITRDAEGTIKFKGKAWKGFIDRRSGHTYVYSRPPHTVYDLTCKSAKYLFKRNGAAAAAFSVDLHLPSLGPIVRRLPNDPNSLRLMPTLRAVVCRPHSA